jgi:hypothetical protein
VNGSLVPTTLSARLSLERCCRESAFGLPFPFSSIQVLTERCSRRLSYQGLALPLLNTQEPISGLGGVADSVVLETIRTKLYANRTGVETLGGNASF